MSRREIEAYTTEAGKVPFETWLASLKDAKARLAIFARIERAAAGDFGDWKPLAGAKGIFEMRIHYGPGFRVFYAVVGQTVIVLLAGSSKRDQDRTIARAKSYLEDYNKRKFGHDPGK